MASRFADCIGRVRATSGQNASRCCRSTRPIGMPGYTPRSVAITAPKAQAQIACVTCSKRRPRRFLAFDQQLVAVRLGEPLVLVLDRGRHRTGRTASPSADCRRSAADPATDAAVERRQRRDGHARRLGRRLDRALRPACS